MTSPFVLPGGAVGPIHTKLTTTGATVVAGDAEYQIPVVWFQCTEISGNTPALTIEVYNATTGLIYYLRNAKAMTAKEEVFKEGIFLDKNEFLRITASVANQVDVVGMAGLGNTLG